MTRTWATRARKFTAALVMIAGFVSALHAQEGARYAYGEILSGFSGTSFQDSSTTGPYVGVQGDFGGYWKDPRVLQFDFLPNFVNGFQWTGPLVGPASNGLDASATFLGGSRFPLTAYFSRQNTPIPDFSGFALLRPTSVLNQRYGFDWSAKFRRLPSLDVRYSNDDAAQLYSNAFSGDSQSSSHTLAFSTSYSLLGWGLNGLYSRSNSDSASTLQLIGATPVAPSGDDSTHLKVISASASRDLPLSSHLVLAYSRTANELLLQGTTTNLAYDRANATYTTHPLRRVDVILQAAYVNDFSSFLAEQSLSGGITNPIFAGSLSQNSAMITAGATVGFQIRNDLRAYAGYTTNEGLGGASRGATLGAVPSSETYTAGLNYFTTLFGGKLSSGYAFSTSRSDSLVYTASTMHSGTVGYEHRLPWQMNLTSSAIVSLQSLEDSHSNRTTDYSFNIGVRRKIHDWEADARVTVARLSYIYPSQTNNNSNSFSVSMTSSRLSFTGRYTNGRNLAYEFGNTIVPVGGTVITQPDLLMNTTRSWGGSGSYNAFRHLMITGYFNYGSQAVNDAASRNSRNFYGKAEYRFRHVKVAGGYGRSSDNYLAGGNGQVNTGFYYFQIKRDFRLF